MVCWTPRRKSIIHHIHMLENARRNYEKHGDDIIKNDISANILIGSLHLTVSVFNIIVKDSTDSTSDGRKLVIIAGKIRESSQTFENEERESPALCATPVSRPQGKPYLANGVNP
eukprot:CAMPEP_0184690986 /NCGR_PEP_ID=MMETSP0312-20130426/31504_1 /TAXON_ID=31354 /ORGANISM="Compsopogon coeruleus, Strain SAG 36.94" /LENGTH=114 /DNA_ID=CAMNT_0027148595 /DNA_START=1886 /DNA_END=2230 /DNA_ORIENTATION=-